MFFQHKTWKKVTSFIFLNDPEDEKKRERTEEHDQDPGDAGEYVRAGVVVVFDGIGAYDVGRFADAAHRGSMH